MSDVLIGALKLDDLNNLIELSRWADFSKPPGFRRILTREELSDFRDVLVLARRLLPAAKSGETTSDTSSESKPAENQEAVKN